jgi:hypothetical protein
MNSELSISENRTVSSSLLLRLGLIAILALSGAGCASFNNNMASTPDHSGAPPYADDPEANGNPAKAWWN